MSAEWAKVEAAVELAKGVAFDDCHKIYLLFDYEQVDKMRGYGYTTLITSREMKPDQMLDKVREWYAESCGLRFVQGIMTAEEEARHEKFLTLVPQGLA